ncbi:hypothetical protein C8Q74DRAFT_779473 [Fomes fomentarius]|nr:hypothetical protein C8Q74DRAFT_779473 [Fomes fomentarius]
MYRDGSSSYGFLVRTFVCASLLRLQFRVRPDLDLTDSMVGPSELNPSCYWQARARKMPTSSESSMVPCSQTKSVGASGSLIPSTGNSRPRPYVAVEQRVLSESSSSSLSPSQKSNNVGAIVGGVVDGGVLGLLLIGTILFCALLRQRSLDVQAKKVEIEPPMFNTVGSTDGRSASRLMSPTVPSVIYDPNDANTFPPSS